MADNVGMSALAVLSSAALKKTAAIFRSLGAAAQYPDWQGRTEVCARCPIAQREGRQVYCGKPLLHQIERRAEMGCGCPVVAKAQDPAEHCPVTEQLVEAVGREPCGCKWCVAARAESGER